MLSLFPLFLNMFDLRDYCRTPRGRRCCTMESAKTAGGQGEITGIDPRAGLCRRRMIQVRDNGWPPHTEIDEFANARLSWAVSRAHLSRHYDYPFRGHSSLSLRVGGGKRQLYFDLKTRPGIAAFSLARRAASDCVSDT